MRSAVCYAATCAVGTTLIAGHGAVTARAAGPPVTVRTVALEADGVIGVALTNGTAVHLADVPVTVHTENGTLVAVRWTEVPTRTPMASAVGGTTLAGHGLRLLVAYVDLAHDEMRVRRSDDGGRTWAPPEVLGPRPAGPALPTACLAAADDGLRGVVAWSAQPSESDGPLSIAQSTDAGWHLAVHAAVRSSGAAVYCPTGGPPEIVWRDHRDGTGPRVAVYRAEVDASGGLLRERRVLAPAYDPSLCGYADIRFVGYHTGTNDAHLARSLDGGVTFAEVTGAAEGPRGQALDDTGKFVSVACGPHVIVATWGDWPTKAAANAKAPSRQLGAVVSTDGGASWLRLRLAGDDTSQGPATVAVSGERALVFWKAVGGVRLAVIEPQPGHGEVPRETP